MEFNYTNPLKGVERGLFHLKKLKFMPRKCKVCGSEIYYSSRDICKICYDEVPAYPPKKSTMKEDEINWNEWMKEFPELDRLWNTIPEPARTLFKIQINNFAKESIEKQSAIKEQVDWGEALLDFTKTHYIDASTVRHIIIPLIAYFKENYSLIPKPKPCNENTTSETKS
jgi:hypothetical protein